MIAMIEKAKRNIGEIFDSHERGSERIEDIISKVSPFLESIERGKEIKEQLRRCSFIEDRKSFIKNILFAIKPFFELEGEEREKIERKIFLKESGFIPLNAILSYGEYSYGENGEEKKLIHIHLAPAREYKRINGGKALFKTIEDGLKVLAGIVDKNKTIEKITATSWIVAKWPGFIKTLGFEIEGEIDEETRRRHFLNETSKISRAVMARDLFIKKYL